MRGYSKGLKKGSSGGHFPIEPKLVGDDLTVEKAKYDGRDCVAINKTTKLCGIPPGVWEYTICGYRVIETCLRGRKGDSN